MVGVHFLGRPTMIQKLFFTIYKMNEWSIRVTPPNGCEVDFIMDEFEQFIACKEIGKKHKKLHYHIYCKTTLNDTEIREYLQLMCDTNATGNGFASCKEAHDGTKGYCVKEQIDVDSITHYKGFTRSDLTDLFAQSKQYRNDKEAERKAKYRKEQKTQKDIVASVVEELGSASDVAEITQKILTHFKDNGELMPTHSSFERILNTVIATKYGITRSVIDYYMPRCYTDYYPQYGNQPQKISIHNT